MAMVIKYGSVKRENVAASGDVTVPTSRWIGVRSTDVTDPERRFNALTDEGKRILGGCGVAQWSMERTKLLLKSTSCSGLRARISCSI